MMKDEEKQEEGPLENGQENEESGSASSGTRDHRLMACCILLLVVVIVLATALSIIEWGESITNDECVKAIELPVTGAWMEGTLDGAGPDPFVNFCHEFPSNDNAMNPVVWYKFLGNGRPVRLFGEGSVGIRTYSGVCGDLSNVYGGKLDEGDNDDGGDNELDCANAAFYTNRGQLYYIAVGSCPYCPSSYYDFRISVHEIDVPQNDLCEDAVELKVGSKTVVQQIQNATWQDVPPYHMDNLHEGHESRGHFPGVWYYIQSATEEELKIRLSDKSNRALGIYSGKCDQLLSVSNDRAQHSGRCPLKGDRYPYCAVALPNPNETLFIYIVFGQNSDDPVEVSVSLVEE